MLKDHLEVTCLQRLIQEREHHPRFNQPWVEKIKKETYKNMYIHVTRINFSAQTQVKDSISLVFIYLPGEKKKKRIVLYIKF